MKKFILIVTICLGIGISLTSCKKEKKEEKTEAVKKEASSKELASNVLYQCPMDCEKGKSYIKEGACPVCKMDLKAKEVDTDSESKHLDNNKEEQGHHDKKESPDNH